MAKIEFNIEGDIEDIEKMLRLLTSKINEDDTLNNNHEDKNEDNDLPKPKEVLESLRETMDNFAEHDDIKNTAVAEYLKFGSKFIDKVIEFNNLSEEEFVLRLFLFVRDYLNTDLPY